MRWDDKFGDKGERGPIFLSRAKVSLPSGGATAIAGGERELPKHAHEQYRKDISDLLRAELNPSLDDVQGAVSMALDLAKRRQAAA